MPSCAPPRVGALNQKSTVPVLFLPSAAKPQLLLLLAVKTEHPYNNRRNYEDFVQLAFDASFCANEIVVKISPTSGRTSSGD